MSTREFRSIGDFLRFAQRLPEKASAAGEAGVEIGTKMIWSEAREMLGTDQLDPVAGYPPWAPLADATQDQRTAQGYPADEALLRQGLLRAHISMGTQALFAAAVGRVGVPSVFVVHEYENEPVDIGELAVWQEIGTPDARSPTPARSFLGRSAAKLKDKVVDAMVAPVIDALLGRTR